MQSLITCWVLDIGLFRLFSTKQNSNISVHHTQIRGPFTNFQNLSTEWHYTKQPKMAIQTCLHFRNVENETNAYGFVKLDFFFPFLFFFSFLVLCAYLEGDIRRIRASVFLGSLVPLLAFLIWNAIALGLSQQVDQIADPVESVMR